MCSFKCSHLKLFIYRCCKRQVLQLIKLIACLTTCVTGREVSVSGNLVYYCKKILNMKILLHKKIANICFNFKKNI